MTENKSNDRGRGHPPKENQFKKGQSGNPKGRPKGSKNRFKLLNDIANEKVKVVQEDGTVIKISKTELMLLQAVNKASKGDLKAFLAISKMLDLGEAKNEAIEAKEKSISISDEKIIQDFLERHNTQNKEGDTNE
jgi:uncharacterized protein (UPF0216 family)